MHRASLDFLVAFLLSLLLFGCQQGSTSGPHIISQIEICEQKIDRPLASKALKRCQRSRNLQLEDSTGYSGNAELDLDRREIFESSELRLSVGWNQSETVKHLEARVLGSSNLKVARGLRLGDSVSSCSQISPQLNRQSASGTGSYNCRLENTSFQGDNYLVSFKIRQDRLQYAGVFLAPKVDQ